VVFIDLKIKDNQMQRAETYITRGVGYSWTELKPTAGQNLFGGGGEIDGSVATITSGHAENVQEEEARTLDTAGTSGNLDVATDPEFKDAANANKEFNFAQHKGDRDDMTKIDLSTTSDGVAAGDILIINDPRNSTFNQTSDALESVMGKLYANPNDESKDTNHDISFKKPNQGINPFSQKSYLRSVVKPHKAKAKAKGKDEDGDSGMNAVDRQGKADGLEYYFAASNMKTDKTTLDEMQKNRQTGLRRTKTMKSQSVLKAHLAVKNEIDDANNEAYELFQSERKGLKATLSDKEQDEFIGRIRNPLSKYTTVQQGVASASHKSHKRRKRSQAGKLNQTLL
jgi:hypothetical protein